MRVKLQFSVKVLVRDGKQGHINTKNNPQTDLQSTLILPDAVTHLTILVPDWSNLSVVNSNNTPLNPDGHGSLTRLCSLQSAGENKTEQFGSLFIFLLLLPSRLVLTTWFLSAYSNLRFIYWVYFIVLTVVWAPGWLTCRWPHVCFCCLSWFCRLYWKKSVTLKEQSI